MPIERVNAPTKRKAHILDLDPERYMVMSRGNGFRCSVSAIGYGKRPGQIRFGVLWDYIQFYDESYDKPSREDFLRKYSAARYGLSTEVTWDGTTLWIAHPMTENQRQRTLDYLEPIRVHMMENPPRKGGTPPQGWDGWYQLTEVDHGQPIRRD